MLILAVPMLMGAGYDARANYILHCEGCHGADGVGGVPEKVPPLRDAIGHFPKVSGGRDFLIQVPGVAQSPLDDAEVAALMSRMTRKGDFDVVDDATKARRERLARERALGAVAARRDARREKDAHAASADAASYFSGETSAAARRRDQWSSSGFAPRRFATMQVTIPGMS